MKLLGATTNGDAATSPRQGEQTGFTKINFETSRTQTLFQPWDGASVAADGPADRAVVRRHPAAGGTVLSRRLAFHPRLLCRPGAGRQGTRGHRRTAAQRPDSKQPCSANRWTSRTSSTCSMTGARLGKISAPTTAAMINSAGGGVRTQLTRYVEVDLEGLARFQPIPDRWRHAWQRRVAAVRRGILLAGADEVLNGTMQASARYRRQWSYYGEGSAHERSQATRRRPPQTFGLTDEHGIAGDRRAGAGDARRCAARAECPADRRRGGGGSRRDQPDREQHRDQSVHASAPR